MHIELEYYKSQYLGGQGDPLTNGKGHRTGIFEGVFGVFVPGEPIKRIRRSKEAFVDVRKEHGDSQLQLSEDQMQRTQARVPSIHALRSA